MLRDFSDRDPNDRGPSRTGQFLLGLVGAVLVAMMVVGAIRGEW